MNLTDQINVKEITNTYLLANTPMFLYRNMRGIDSLRNLASDNELGILVSEYNERITKKERKAEDVAIAYSILLAITFMDYREAVEAFKKFDLSKLEWGSDIRDIFVSRAIVLTNIELSVKPKVVDDQGITSDSVASLSYINMQRTTK